MPDVSPKGGKGDARRYPTDVEHWEAQAANWAAWARGPLPDAYPAYAPRFLQLLPPPPLAALEVGCGEGRVCRDLRAAGYDPVGIDGSATLVKLAREADPEGTYLVGDAASLPFGDAGFPLVIAYNSLMDVDDMPGAVREISRVLEPGGYLCACVTHPTADAGRFDGDGADAPFVISGSYLETKRFEADASQNGVTMEFRGWAYPIEAYARAFEDAGLLIEAIREPPIVEGGVPQDDADGRWLRIPMFLFLRARKG